MTVDEFLKIFGVASPVILIILGAWLKKRTDRVMNEKFKAEADLATVTVDKVKAETDSYFLQNAVKLVDEFKRSQAEKDEAYATRLAAAAERQRMLEDRVGRMEEAMNRLRAAIAAHGTWAATALSDLRRNNPDYPSPPALPDLER